MKTSTFDPSGAGSQGLRIALPNRFWLLTGAHVALLNGSQIVRNRRCWVRSDQCQIVLGANLANLGPYPLSAGPSWGSPS